MQRLFDKKKKLEKSRDDLLKVEKPSDPVQRIGYDLLLMSELPKDGKPEKGKVYLEKVQKNDSKLKYSELKYILMQSDDKVANGTLKINTTKDLTPDILNTFKREILEMITKEGYTASKSESRLKQLGKGALNAAKTAEIKVRQATDILTNDKEERGKKIEAIQAELKEINKKYKERISSLEIRVVMEIVNEIDKKINIDNTIESLENKGIVSERGRNNLPKNKSKSKKQKAEIDADEATTSKDLIYFMKFRSNPTETLEDLKKSRAELMNEVKELSALTDRGDAIYLQEKDVQLDSEMNRAAIVSLYRENDAIKSQLETLKKQLEALLKTAPSKDTAGVSVPPLKKEASQRESLPQKTPSQGPGPLKKEVSQPEASKQAATRGSGPLSEDVIKKQLGNLRPIPTAPQGR